MEYLIQVKNLIYDIREIYEALDLLMDRTKPNKIGFAIEE